jgi:hypothetical protein
MPKPIDPSLVHRRTRTVAIPIEIHDQLRIVALHQSLQEQRRITLQDVAEVALQQYLEKHTTRMDTTESPNPLSISLQKEEL